MENTSQRSEARGIRRTAKAFRRARLLLTAWYAVGVFALLTVFNLLIYFIFTQKIHVEDERGGGVLVVEGNTSAGARFDDDMPIVSGNDGGAGVDDDLLAAQAFASGIIMLLVVVLAWALSQKTLRPIEASYERQERFIADAAHELRTPLAVMRAGADVALARERSAEAYRAFIADMLEETKRLSRLSDDLLTLARGGSVASALHDIDLNTVVRDMCDLVRPYAQEKGLTLSYGGLDSPVTVRGAVADIQRALMNVITNAVDYTPEGGVTVTLVREPKGVSISISDTGIGIAPDDIPLVFDRFYKADSSRGTRKNGAGLGLAIVKEIVERHGGSVAIKSRVGQGTTVTLGFPLAG